MINKTTNLQKIVALIDSNDIDALAEVLTLINCNNLSDNWGSWSKEKWMKWLFEKSINISDDLNIM